MNILAYKQHSDEFRSVLKDWGYVSRGSWGKHYSKDDYDILLGTSFWSGEKKVFNPHYDSMKVIQLKNNATNSVQLMLDQIEIQCSKQAIVDGCIDFLEKTRHLAGAIQDTANKHFKHLTLDEIAEYRNDYDRSNPNFAEGVFVDDYESSTTTYFRFVDHEENDHQVRLEFHKFIIRKDGDIRSTHLCEMKVPLKFFDFLNVDFTLFEEYRKIYDDCVSELEALING